MTRGAVVLGMLLLLGSLGGALASAMHATASGDDAGGDGSPQATGGNGSDADVKETETVRYRFREDPVPPRTIWENGTIELTPRSRADVVNLSSVVPFEMPVNLTATLTWEPDEHRTLALKLEAPREALYQVTEATGSTDAGLSEIRLNATLARLTPGPVRLVMGTRASFETAPPSDGDPVSDTDYMLKVDVQPFSRRIPGKIPVVVDAGPNTTISASAAGPGQHLFHRWSPEMTNHVYGQTGPSEALTLGPEAPRGRHVLLASQTPGPYSLSARTPSNLSQELRPLGLTQTAHPPFSVNGTTERSFTTDRAPAFLALRLVSHGGAAVFKDVEVDIRSERGPVLQGERHALSTFVDVGAVDLHAFADPPQPDHSGHGLFWTSGLGQENLTDGTYEVEIKALAEGDIQAQILEGGFFRPLPETGSISWKDPAGDLSQPHPEAYTIWSESDQAERDQFDLLFTEIAHRGPDQAEVRIGVHDLSEIRIPSEYDAVVYAAAVQTEQGPFMGAYMKTHEDQAFFCSRDSLLLTDERQDPRELGWERVDGAITTSPGATDGGSGVLEITLPASCFDTEPGSATAVTEVASGVFLLGGPEEQARGGVEATDTSFSPKQIRVFHPSGEPTKKGEASGAQARPSSGANERENGSLSRTSGRSAAGDPAAPAGDTTDAAWPVWLWGLLGLGLVATVGGGAWLALRDREEERQPPTEGQLFLGKYAVEGRLGQGAFGTVWLAEHVHLERKVVIKQLHPQLAHSEEARRRFEREAKLLAGLDHPNVTTIHDVELVEEAWYLVMEYVEGGSLEDKRQDPLPLEMVRDALADVLTGLSYIHEQGVVHRDLKPANLLVTAEGDVKIADFGVARPSGPQATVLTQTGSPPGTPLFMAPEQLEGQRGDERSDLYAVAVVAYSLLTGRYYLGDPPDDLARLREQVFQEGPRLPVEGFPDEINAWLQRGLATDPDDRFQSAEEMRSALQRSRVPAGR